MDASRFQTRTAIYNFIADKLQSLLPDVISSNKVLFDMFIVLLMNEIKITDAHRKMYIDKIKTSLDELLFAMRTAIIIQLDNNKVMFDERFYEEIYNEIFQTRDYNLFQDAIKSYQIVLDQIDRVEIEVNHMISKFNKKQAKYPYENTFWIGKDSNGDAYETYSDDFFKELEKNPHDKFTFRKSSISKNYRNSMGKVIGRTVIGLWVSCK